MLETIAALGYHPHISRVHSWPPEAYWLATIRLYPDHPKRHAQILAIAHGPDPLAALTEAWSLTKRRTGARP